MVYSFTNYRQISLKIEYFSYIKALTFISKHTNEYFTYLKHSQQYNLTKTYLFCVACVQEVHALHIVKHKHITTTQ